MDNMMNQKIRSIKEIHKYDLCLFKVGAFYHAYGRDSYILAYLFDYKLKDISDKEYLNQLAGYKKYISGISNKEVKTFLYSVIDNTLKEV